MSSQANISPSILANSISSLFNLTGIMSPDCISLTWATLTKSDSDKVNLLQYFLRNCCDWEIDHIFVLCWAHYMIQTGHKK